MPNKYRYSRSLVEEKIVFWLTLIFSLWFIYHLFTSNNYFTPSQSGLLIIGEVLVLFISWSFAYSPQKTFNSKVIHKKLTTNSYGWRRRRFYYHLSLDSGVDLLVTKEIFSTVQEGDDVSGVYRAADKHVLQFNSEMPDNRNYEQELMELNTSQQKLANSKRTKTLVFLALFISLLVFGWLMGILY